MPKTFEGQLSAAGLQFAIVVSRFNSFVTERLLAGALDALARSGADMEQVDTVKSARILGNPSRGRRTGAPKAIRCHHLPERRDSRRYAAFRLRRRPGSGRESRKLSAETGVPVAFGVLTTNTFEQAIDRAGGKSGNKGFDAAMTAIEMANLMRTLRQDA